MRNALLGSTGKDVKYIDLNVLRLGNSLNDAGEKFLKDGDRKSAAECFAKYADEIKERGIFSIAAESYWKAMSISNGIGDAETSRLYGTKAIDCYLDAADKFMAEGNKPLKNSNLQRLEVFNACKTALEIAEVLRDEEQIARCNSKRKDLLMQLKPSLRRI